MLRRWGFTACACVLVLAACGGGGDDDAEADQTTSSGVDTTVDDPPSTDTSTSDDDRDGGDDRDLVSPLDVRIGDCFNDPDEEGEVSEVRLLACDEPHDNEAYFLFDIEGDVFSGSDEIEETSDERCIGEFDSYVGVAFDDSVLNAGALFYPTDESWEMGDREVVCALWHGDLEALTRSMKDAGE
jgi:Septum formation